MVEADPHLTMPEQGQRTLLELATELAGDGKWANFHCKVFSFILPDPAIFVRYADQLQLEPAAFPNGHPAFVLVGDASSLPIYTSSPIPVVVPEAKLQVHMKLDRLQLPPASYLILISPFEKGSENSSYRSAFQSIDFLRTLFSLNFATATNYIHVASFDLGADGRISSAGDAFRMPMDADNFKIVDFSAVPQILDRLKTQSAVFRTRFQTACDFFGVAIDQRSEMLRFASYWIALEIQSGTANRIRQSLADAYSHQARTLQEIEVDLKFDAIKRLRHDLFHDGLFRKFSAFHERLMQLYFWDIAIHQLGLPHRGYSALLIANVVDSA